MPAEEGAVSKRQGEKHHRADDTEAERRRPPRKAIKPCPIGRHQGRRASAIKAAMQAPKIEADAAMPAAHPLTRQQAQRSVKGAHQPLEEVAVGICPFDARNTENQITAIVSVLHTRLRRRNRRTRLGSVHGLLGGRVLRSFTETPNFPTAQDAASLRLADR